MAELKFEIIKSIGVLSESSNGWKKEVNIVSGMAEIQNMTSVAGTRIVQRWEKA